MVFDRFKSGQVFLQDNHFNLTTVTSFVLPENIGRIVAHQRTSSGKTEVLTPLVMGLCEAGQLEKLKQYWREHDLTMIDKFEDS